MKNAGFILEETVPSPSPVTQQPVETSGERFVNELKTGLSATKYTEPPSTPAVVDSSKTAQDSLDEVIIEAHDRWVALTEASKSVVDSFLFLYAEDSSIGPPAEVYTLLGHLGSKPRDFVATLLFATQERHVVQNLFIRLYRRLFDKSIESSMVKKVTERAKSLSGPKIGVKTYATTSTPAKPKPSKVAPKAAPKAAPKVVPAPVDALPSKPGPFPPREAFEPIQPSIWPVLPLLGTEVRASDRVMGRFTKVLLAALEGGERLGVQKSALGYSITYEDGVTVTFGV
jgi:hypothetical protein